MTLYVRRLENFSVVSNRKLWISIITAKCVCSHLTLDIHTKATPQLSIIVEFIAGKVTTTIDRLIALYRPDSVVVGTRGTRGMKAWGAAFGAPGMGSVSKYCLSHSPVPIIVVRPESKVRKAMEKRKADPKRGKHFDEYVALLLFVLGECILLKFSVCAHSGTRLTATRSNIPSVPMMSSVTR